MTQNADGAGTECILVAISGSPNSERLVRDAHRLAAADGLAWEAIHIETPEVPRGQAVEFAAADALGLAARLGATIATIPAPSVVDGILAHLQSSSARQLVLGAVASERWRWPWQRSLVERLLARDPELVIHVRARRAGPAMLPAEHGPSPRRSISLGAHLLAVGLVAATLVVAEVLKLFLGTRPLDLLFLFPVIAVAARRGLSPALLAAALSVVSYNFFLLQPELSFAPAAPQNLVMTVVLVAIAAYTSFVTNRMRGRLRLSDRSARENASIAALAQKLTRDADWEATAQTICEHVHSLLGLQTLVYREIDGELAVAGAVPPARPLDPVDQAALDWVWEHGSEAGAGTGVLSAADWQFQPLKTSLGMLAVLGIARDDGRDPVRADQRVLLLTLVAQAALAHERLRLEDKIRSELAHSEDQRTIVP
jgi:two-component system sensor histidine kinase KdpD